MPVEIEIGTLPWPCFASGVQAAASTGRSPIGMLQGIAALQRAMGTS